MFVIEVPFCDLDLMYKSQQAFRWKKVNEGKYLIVKKDKIILAQQKKNRKAILCSEEDFYNFWYSYFDINYDYLKSSFDINKFLKKYCKDNLYAKIVLERNMNLRIIKNDLLESIIYFTLNSKEDFDSLLRIIGIKKHNTLDGLSVTWYTLPPIDNINIISTTIHQSPQGSFELLASIISKLKCQSSILGQIEASGDYLKTYNLLSSINNDPLWIKNIMFYSLGFKQAFPIDEEDKYKMNLLNLKPTYFLEFDKSKGLMLEYLKIVKGKK